MGHDVMLALKLQFGGKTEIKVMLLLKGAYFREDSRAVYNVVASLTLGTSAYSYIKKFEKSRDSRQALISLKLQFGREAYEFSRSNAANEVSRSTTFTSPTHNNTYNQHVEKFEDAYNELALLGEVPKQSKVRLFCKSLKEKFMKAVSIDTQRSKETGLNFEKAMAHLKSVRDLHITDFDEKGEERYIAELGMEPRKRKRGSGGPRDKRKKKGGGASGAGGGLQLHGYSDKEWHDLPAATKAKVNVGRAGEKAVKREGAVASLAKPADADAKEAEQGGAKFSRGAHA
jgi:hypothetical protein